MRDEPETTEGGAEIVEHTPRTKPFTPVAGDEAIIAAVAEHIERHLGKIEKVFHEKVSDLVHMDIHVVAPREDRPFYTLVTSGMSQRRMIVHEDDEASTGYAELCISLPPDWPVGKEHFDEEENFWPVRCLLDVATLPHDYNTYIGFGHTIPNGDPPEPYAADVGFSSVVVLPPIRTPEEFWELKITDDREVDFFALYPLYPEELHFKLKKGSEALMDRFERFNVTDIVNIQRRNSCKKRFLGLF